MSRPTQRLWVLAYDIGNDKARRRVHDTLVDFGNRVQFSVFECWLDYSEMTELRGMITEYLDDSDSLRWYPLCRWCNHDVQYQGLGENAENDQYYIP